MSDVSQGPGWWQASDGKWYPPEQAPGAQPTTPPAATTPDPFGAPTGAPAGAPFGAPGSPAGGVGPNGTANVTFSVGDAFNWGFKKFQENIGPILIAALIIFAVTMVVEAIIWFGLIGAALSSTTTHTTDYGYTYTTTSSGGLTVFLFGYGIAMVVMILGSFVIQMAIIRATLMITHGEEVTLNRMFSTDRLGSFMGAAVLVALGTYIGTFLCVIPGIIVMFFSFFFGWFVIDKQMGAMDSIKASWSLVNNNMGTMVGFFVGCLIAYVIGAILCGIGLLVAVPVIVLATGYVYKRTQGEAVAA